MGCPPNFVNSSEQEQSASNSEKPSTLRPEPFACSPEYEITIQGLPKWSTKRAATMPITPWCHSRPATTKTWSYKRSGCSLKSSRALWNNSDSICRRQSLSSQISSANSRASSGSSLTKRRTALPGEPIRPVALMRGTMEKATLPADNSRPSIPACSSSSRTPRRSERDSNCKPFRTKTRFSPVSGTTSPMVPTATKSA